MQGWTRIEMGDQVFSLATPYVHWWIDHEQPLLRSRSQLKSTFSVVTRTSVSVASFPPEGEIQALFSGSRSDAFEEQLKGFGFDTSFLSNTSEFDSRFGTQIEQDGTLDIIALPEHAKVRPLTRPAQPVGPGTGQFGEVTADTVIVGIIDDGISLAHPRFQFLREDGTWQSRILAAWQQDGDFNGRSKICGREIYRGEIEAALNAPDLNGTGEPSDIYRHLFPAPKDEPSGMSDIARHLMSHIGHGTHVMDLACGEDPTAPIGTLPDRDRVNVIAVGLPARSSVGMAGTFLEYYVVYAMRRIVELADEIWQANDLGEGGFPIVINLSYGQQAGTKTGTSLIEKEFLQLQEGRPDGAPLELVMPAGNDNLTRCNARWNLSKATTDFEVPWRILPQDQSSNFVEVWTDLTTVEAENGVMPLALKILRPGQQADDVDWIDPNDPKYSGSADGYSFFRPEGDPEGEPDDILRVYSERVPVPDVTGNTTSNGQDRQDSSLLLERQRWVIAVKPTLDHSDPTAAAPAGKWTILLRWAERAVFENGDDYREVYVNVQVDQDPSQNSRTNFRSYFDKERYRTHLPSGRQMDTYAYGAHEWGLASSDPENPGTGGNLEPADEYFSVQRKGTQNSLANHRRVVAVGGYRVSDGRPADFSATSYPFRRIPDVLRDQVRTAPTASFPVDEVPTLRGILAAGVHAGGKVRLQGTSFAAPQATRWIVSQLLNGWQAHDLEASAEEAAGLPDLLSATARQVESDPQRPANYEDIVADKIGAGRMVGSYAARKEV